MSKLLDGWSPAARHIAIAAALLAVALVLFFLMTLFASAQFSKVGDLVPHASTAMCDALKKEASPDAATYAKSLLPSLSGYEASEAERQRIATQAVTAQKLECMHMGLLDLYVRNYYAAVVTTMLFGGIAAIVLFLVGNKGWSNSNRAHVLHYESLLDGMASHTATPTLVPAACTSQCTKALGRVCDSSFPPAAFIACTDAALPTDLPFGLDPKSQPDYQKQLGTLGSSSRSR